MKWGLYMWIYLDSEDLCGGVSKKLPLNVAMEVGLGHGDDHDEEPVLVDDTKKTKKRVRSTGGSTAGGPSGSEGASMGGQGHPEPARDKFLEGIARSVEALVAPPFAGPISNARADAHAEAILDNERVSADEKRARVLSSLSSHPDERVREQATERLLALLGSGKLG